MANFWAFILSKIRTRLIHIPTPPNIQETSQKSIQNLEECPFCEGTGMRQHSIPQSSIGRFRNMDGEFSVQLSKCQACDGTGHLKKNAFAKKN